MTVVVAAATAGGGLSWLGLLSDERAALPTPPTPRAASASAEPDTSTAAVPPVLEPAPSPPSPVRVEPPAVDPAFERTLASVSQSYRTLDAATLTAVWPGADTASLSQAFSTLKYQTLSFDRCELRPNGDASAVASCEVSIAAAPKWGDQALQRRRESWTLVMNRSGDRWTIAGVSVR